MKASQFSDAQKAFILKQGDEGVSIAEICFLSQGGDQSDDFFKGRKSTPACCRQR